MMGAYEAAEIAFRGAQVIPATPEGDPVSDLNIDAIRRRAAAATPGPWVAGWRSLDREQVMLAPDLPAVEFSCDAQGRKNAKFVAHARQDVPALLAEVDRLREAPEPAPRDGDLTRLLRDAMRRFGVPAVMAEAGRLAQQRL